MRGVGIYEYGDVHKLTYVETDTDIVGAEDLLISIKASGVNNFDCKVRSGKLREVLPFKLPLILGWDASGTIKSIGRNVKGFKIDDNVYFRPETMKHGTYANEIVVPAMYVSLMPNNISHIEAASFPLVGLTAWQALIEKGNLEKGMNVLILAGSGGIGTFAIQLAKAFGAYVCTTTSSKNEKFVRWLGADEVMTYDNGPMHSKIEYDILLDTLGGVDYVFSLSFLKRNAVVLSLIKDRDVTPSLLKAQKETEKNLIINTITTREDGIGLFKIKDLIEQGKILPIVNHIFPLSVEGAIQAHLAIQSRRTVGKIVLSNEQY